MIARSPEAKQNAHVGDNPVLAQPGVADVV